MDAASAAAKWNNETGGNVCQEVATMPACHFDDSSREREEKKKKETLQIFFSSSIKNGLRFDQVINGSNLFIL